MLKCGLYGMTLIDGRYECRPVSVLRCIDNEIGRQGHGRVPYVTGIRSMWQCYCEYILYTLWCMMEAA